MDVEYVSQVETDDMTQSSQAKRSKRRQRN